MGAPNLAWTCDLHRLTTTGDCPRCDDEAIASVEAIHAPKCATCDRVLNPGEEVWADDWKAVDLATGTVRMETRYVCEGCS